MRYRACFLISLLAFGGCSTTVETNPARTATEELVISAAAERAAAKLALDIPENSRVYVEAGNFEGTDSKNALAAIRGDLLERGMRLTEDKKKADVIVEARAGALSTDRKTTLIGLPSFNVPLPLASAPLSIPELALYSREEQKGVAKFAVLGYGAKDGRLVDAQAPQYGFAHNTKYTVFFFISWTANDALPEEEESVHTLTGLPQAASSRPKYPSQAN